MGLNDFSVNIFDTQFVLHTYSQGHRKFSENAGVCLCVCMRVFISILIKREEGWIDR